MAKSDYSFFNNKFTYDIRDKKRNLGFYIDNTLNKTSKMFKWDGLPETISPDILEKQLQSLGYVAFCKITEPEKHPGYYTLAGEFGGSPNRYMLPSLFIVANPALSQSYTYKVVYPFGDAGAPDQSINGECIVVKNDSYYRGLLPIIARYGTLLTETDITAYMAIVLSRTQYAISAGDEVTKASATKFIDDLTGGKLSVIGDNTFIESLKTLPLSTNNGHRLTELIEMSQYLKGSLLNELGLDANYNLKRERLQSNETELNKDGLTPLIDNMLESRKLACKQIKDLYGLDITVELAGAWEHEKVAMLAETAIDLQQLDGATTSPETDDISDSNNSGVVDGETPNSPETDDISVISDSSPETDEKDKDKKDGD